MLNKITLATGTIALLIPLFVSAGTCPNLTRNLSYGLRGSDVVQLQQFLIAQNLLASDSATGYFGKLTQAAVQSWQKKSGIVSSGTPATTGYGVVGPRTRAAIALACKTGTATPSALYNTNPYTPPAASGPVSRPPGEITSPIGTVAPTSPLIPQSCTPLSPQTQMLACSAGLTGSITQTRTSSCPGPIWSVWSTTSNTCQTPPPGLSKPSTTVLSPIAQSKMYFNDWSVQPMMNAEITPWSLGSARMGGWHSFLISTARTFFCATPDNMFTLPSEKGIKDMLSCHYKEGPALNAGNVANVNALPMWKRDYYAAMSGHILKTGTNDWTAYMINHGEMENNDPALNPESGLSSCVPAPNMGYGALPCSAANWWGSYNAFIGMSSFPWTQAGLADNGSLTTDYGPIAWPTNGYIESKDGGATWIKATDGGVRTPSSIVRDGYLYVYYEDLSQGNQADDRGSGLKLMRAPITSSGIDPKSFRTYYNGDFTDFALPSGYDISNYYTKWSAKGGRASNIFPNEPVKLVAPTSGTGRADQRQVGEVISFSVAKVNGTDWYLGVGYELSKGVTLRLSKDLIRWSEPTVVPGTESNYWSGVDLQRVPLLYPRLANADGDSNTDIDPNDFYIIGTQTASHGASEAKVVNAIHLKLNLQ